MREKSLSFIQLTVAEAFVKSSLETYVLQRLQGQFSVFHFLILFWKALKFAKFFLTIRNNVPDNCINIGYNIGPVKCRPNKRSGKLRIKSQIVWVRFFLCKVLLTTGKDSPLLTLYISSARHWVHLSWIETETSFSKGIWWLFISIYYTQTSFMKPVYFFICRAIVTHPDQ